MPEAQESHYIRNTWVPETWCAPILGGSLQASYREPCADDELDGQILSGSRQSFCRECGFSINVLGPNLGGSRLPFCTDHVSAGVLQQPLPLSKLACKNLLALCACWIVVG